MSDEYEVYVRKKEDSSGCVAIFAGIVFIIIILAVIFLISPLAIGVWLLVSIFTRGWSKDTKILTAVWIGLSLIVPSVYYMEVWPYSEFFIELDEIIWIYYVFAGLGITATLFFGIYKTGITLLSNPNENFQNGDSNTKILVGGTAIVLLLCCICLSSFGVIFYMNN